jgi:hypothetical protein
VPKCLEYVIKWSARTAVRRHRGKHKSQIAKVCRCLFDLVEALHAHHCGDCLISARHDNFGSVLGVGNQSGDPRWVASLTLTRWAS